MTSTSSDKDTGHDWHSAEYVANWIGNDTTRDEERRPLLRRAAALLPSSTDGSLHVLDVGGGYGAFSAEVLSLHPHATVVLHDYSAPMIREARQRLSRFADRVDYRMADMAADGWTASLGGPFDAVISALAIHNLDSPDLMRRVYRDLFAIVRPGGCLLNMDLLFPTGPGQAGLYRRDPARDPRWDVYVAPFGLRDHLDWLAEAGFAEVDCVWKDFDEGLLWGLRDA
jgi:tRNA (cmo5U34)-methyltransferase